MKAAGVYRIALQAALCELAQEGNIVYHGRAGQEFFPGIRHVLNVFVDTPRESRIQQVKTRKGLGDKAANEYLDELDRIRSQRLKELFNIDWRDTTRYDFVLNTSRTSLETAAHFIAEASQREEYRPTPESLRAVNDLAISARVQAILITSAEIGISSLEVQTKDGEVHVSGLLEAGGLEKLIVDAVKKVPGVTGVKTHFVVTPPEPYMYGDGR